MKKKIKISDKIDNNINWKPYIKPTKHVHDSGFGTFEIGYCKLGKDHRISEKVILGKNTDHISNLDFSKLSELSGIYINMDLTLDGYIRFWSSSRLLRWQYDFAVSLMYFELRGNF